MLSLACTPCCRPPAPVRINRNGLPKVLNVSVPHPSILLQPAAGLFLHRHRSVFSEPLGAQGSSLQPCSLGSVQSNVAALLCWDPWTYFPHHPMGAFFSVSPSPAFTSFCALSAELVYLLALVWVGSCSVEQGQLICGCVWRNDTPLQTSFNYPWSLWEKGSPICPSLLLDDMSMAHFCADNMSAVCSWVATIISSLSLCLHFSIWISPP